MALTGRSSSRASFGGVTPSNPSAGRALVLHPCFLGSPSLSTAVGGPGLSDLSRQRGRKSLPHPLRLGDLTDSFNISGGSSALPRISRRGRGISCELFPAQHTSPPAALPPDPGGGELQTEPLQGHGFSGEFNESCGPSVQKDARRHRRVRAAPKASLAPS